MLLIKVGLNRHLGSETVASGNFKVFRDSGMWPGFSNSVHQKWFYQNWKEAWPLCFGGKRNLVGDRRKSPVCGWIKHMLQGFGNTFAEVLSTLRSSSLSSGLRFIQSILKSLLWSHEFNPSSFYFYNSKNVHLAMMCAWLGPVGLCLFWEKC